MAFEIVKEITFIEKEGEELVKRAYINSQDELKKAEANAAEMLKKTKKEAEEYYNGVIARFEGEAAKVVDGIKNDTKEKENKYVNLTPDVMDKAVKMVIERIVNGHGNS